MKEDKKMVCQIVTFLLWPVIIALSYFLCAAAVKRFERNHGTSAED